MQFKPVAYNAIQWTDYYSMYLLQISLANERENRVKTQIFHTNGKTVGNFMNHFSYTIPFHSRCGIKSSLLSCTMSEGLKVK